MNFAHGGEYPHKNNKTQSYRINVVYNDILWHDMICYNITCHATRASQHLRGRFSESGFHPHKKLAPTSMNTQFLTLCSLYVAQENNKTYPEPPDLRNCEGLRPNVRFLFIKTGHTLHQIAISSHKVDLQKLKVRGSNPKVAAYLSLNLPCESSKLQGVSPVFPDRTFGNLKLKHWPATERGLWRFAALMGA